MKIVISGGDLEEHLTAALDGMFEERLGPAIANDAIEVCPKDLGNLAKSIRFFVEDHKLIISATGSTRREYALYVECGHRIVHVTRNGLGYRKYDTGGIQPPQPFLRAALYRERHG